MVELATVMVELHQEEWSLGHWKWLCYYKEPFARAFKSFICFYSSPKHHHGYHYYTQFWQEIKRIQSFLFYFRASGSSSALVEYPSEAQTVTNREVSQNFQQATGKAVKTTLHSRVRAGAETRHSLLPLTVLPAGPGSRIPDLFPFVSQYLLQKFWSVQQSSRKNATNKWGK